MSIQISGATANKNRPTIIIDSTGNIILALKQLAPGSSYAVWNAYYTKKPIRGQILNNFQVLGQHYNQIMKLPWMATVMIPTQANVTFDGLGNSIVAWNNVTQSACYETE